MGAMPILALVFWLSCLVNINFAFWKNFMMTAGVVLWKNKLSLLNIAIYDRDLGVFLGLHSSKSSLGSFRSILVHFTRDLPLLVLLSRIEISFETYVLKFSSGLEYRNCLFCKSLLISLYH